MNAMTISIRTTSALMLFLSARLCAFDENVGGFLYRTRTQDWNTSWGRGVDKRLPASLVELADGAFDYYPRELLAAAERSTKSGFHFSNLRFHQGVPRR